MLWTLNDPVRGVRMRGTKGERREERRRKAVEEREEKGTYSIKYRTKTRPHVN